MSCAGQQETEALVLEYDSFGPPVVAQEVIGMDWWQWLDHGDSRPRKYPIKVVIYSGISLAEVKSRYPVKPELEQDYRYLEYSRAIQYLDRLISENALESLTTQLAKTKNEIESSFEPEAAVQVY